MSAGPIRGAITRAELRRVVGVDESFLVELEEEELIASNDEGLFARATIERARVCWSLHHDLGVNLAGLAVCARLMDRMQEERRQFREVLAWLRESLAPDDAS